jgi:hypothetical protein
MPPSFYGQAGQGVRGGYEQGQEQRFGQGQQQPYAQTYRGYAPPRGPRTSGTGKRIGAVALVIAIAVGGITIRAGLRHLLCSDSNTMISAPSMTIPAFTSGGGGGDSATATAATATATDDPSTTTTAGADYAVGDCMDAEGDTDVTDTKVSCWDVSANYRVLKIIPDVSGTIDSDASKCYSVSWDDEEIDKSGGDGTEYLYCLTSTTGRHSPRRALEGDCISADDSSGYDYYVSCSDSTAKYVVVGRLNDSSDDSGCDAYSSATRTLTYSNGPPFVLCVKEK